MMRPVLITLLTALCLATLLFVLIMPISTNFMNYCRWRLFSGIQPINGTVLSHQSTIHYRVYGHGKPILLLHGGLSNKLCWFSQLPMLTAEGFMPVLVDSRGHGDSELGEQELTYKLLADDSMTVLDSLKIEKADILGWSDGANTALLMARSWPQRVGKIVAISGNYTTEGLTDEARKENFRQSSKVANLLNRLITGAGNKLELLEKRLKLLWEKGPDLTDDDLKTISSSILIIVGEKDLITVEHAQLMNELLPDSSLKIIKNGGHTTLITNAEEVNKVIAEFLFYEHQDSI